MEGVYVIVTWIYCTGKVKMTPNVILYPFPRPLENDMDFDA